MADEISTKLKVAGPLEINEKTAHKLALACEIFGFTVRRSHCFDSGCQLCALLMNFFNTSSGLQVLWGADA